MTEVKEAQPATAVAPVREWIEVENPATGEVAGRVPKMTPGDVGELAARARAAQPGWESMGFEGRGRVLLRAQRWMLDNSRRVIDTIVSETGKAHEDAQTAEIGYAAPALGFWVKNAPKFLADERVSSRSPFLKGKKIVMRYRPLGVVGVIGPWNYPLTNSFGDCIPALDAVAKGARVAVGGHRADAPGRFYEPTVLLDVDHTMACMTEETFGPTLPIMKVADADEAVALANDSCYGLQASVWTRDTIRGEVIASRIESGVANVNEHQINYFALEAPMGGWKQSGLGSRHGPEGIRKYARKQVSVIARFGLKREVFMFPYSKRNARLLAGALKLLHGRGKR